MSRARSHILFALLILASVLAAPLSVLSKVADGKEPIDWEAWEAYMFEEQKPRWEIDTRLRFEAGYDDNVLRSPEAGLERPGQNISPFLRGPDGSSFARAELETLALRIDKEKARALSGFAHLERKHFFSLESGDSESQAYLSGMFEQGFGENWKAGATLSYLHTKEFYDLSSAEEIESPSVSIRYHQIKLRPWAQRRLSESWSLRFEPAVKRNFFDRSEEDYTQAGGGLTLALDYGDGSSAAFSLSRARRFFDTREKKDRFGAIAEGRLRYDYTTFGADWRHRWISDKSFSTRLSGAFVLREDNGEGYYNYERLDGLFGLDWSVGRWTLSAEASVQHYVFSDAFEFFLLDDNSREWTVGRAAVEARREIGGGWSAYGRFQFEKAVSRRVLSGIDEYEQNVMALGVELKF